MRKNAFSSSKIDNSDSGSKKADGFLFLPEKRQCINVSKAVNNSQEKQKSHSLLPWFVLFTRDCAQNELRHSSTYKIVMSHWETIL